jgi:predicted glycosyltransferase
MYSTAVMTGSGTMAREAACMNKVAISFFPSTKKLSVDQKLIDEGKMFHSRNVRDIVDYINNSKDLNNKFDNTRSLSVKNEVVELVKNIICS